MGLTQDSMNPAAGQSAAKAIGLNTSHSCHLQMTTSETNSSGTVASNDLKRIYDQVATLEKLVDHLCALMSQLPMVEPAKYFEFDWIHPDDDVLDEFLQRRAEKERQAEATQE